MSNDKSSSWEDRFREINKDSVKRRPRIGRALAVVIGIALATTGLSALGKLEVEIVDGAICKTEINEAYATFFVDSLSPRSLTNTPELKFRSELLDMARRAKNPGLQEALKTDSRAINGPSDKPKETWLYCGDHYKF